MPPPRIGDTMENKGTIAIGIGALLLMLNGGLAVTGFVDGQIENGVQTLVSEGYDGIDDDGERDYSFDFDEEWLNPSSEKAYFANSITNLEDVLAGSEPVYERLGPFIYYENTTREVIEYDYDEETITYSGYEVFEWCEDCTWEDEMGVSHASVSGDTIVNQVNILWNTQRIGGMGGASGGIFYGETFARSFFAAGMVEFDLSNRAPSIWASNDISTLAADSGGSWLGDMGPEEQILLGSYASSLETSGLDGSMDGDSYDSSVIASIFYEAKDGSGNRISLTDDIGPLVIAGMGAPSDSVTPARAALYGYSGEFQEHMDWAVYSLAATKFSEHGGGAEITNATPKLKQRFLEVSTLNYDLETLDTLLFDDNIGLMGSFEIDGIELPGMVIGLLLPLQLGDYSGVMDAYGIGITEVQKLADYVEPWVGLGITGSPRSFEQVLNGGETNMDAGDWWHTSFGAADPLAGQYIDIGLNRGSFAGMSDLSMEKSEFILNDPEIGLKSSFPASFMYGELSGLTLPDENGEQVAWDDDYVAELYDIPTDAAKALRDWLANFYFDTVMPTLLTYVSGNTAYTSQPISNWLYGFEDAVNTFFGRFAWQSLETNDTFYGSGYWVDDDPLVNSDGLNDFDDDNDTWVIGISTGDRSVYKMSTAEDTRGQRLAQGYINSDGNQMCDFDYDANGNFIGYDLPCEDGRVYGMTPYLTWRSDHREDATQGLQSAHAGNSDRSLSGTVGGLASATDPFNVNVAGYAIGTSTQGDKVTYKGIEMYEHSVVLDPSNTQIQGKLLGTGTFVDSLPGALPVYLEANIDLKVEPVSTAIMYGKAEVIFHLDTRGPGSINPDWSEGSTETMPVFEIHTFSEIDDDAAGNFTAAVTDNMGAWGWTNFGGDAGGALAVLHTVIAAMYVISIGLLGYGLSDQAAREQIKGLLGREPDDISDESE